MRDDRADWLSYNTRPSLVGQTGLSTGTARDLSSSNRVKDRERERARDSISGHAAGFMEYAELERTPRRSRRFFLEDVHKASALTMPR